MLKQAASKETEEPAFSIQLPAPSTGADISSYTKPSVAVAALSPLARLKKHCQIRQ